MRLFISLFLLAVAGRTASAFCTTPFTQFCSQARIHRQGAARCLTMSASPDLFVVGAGTLGNILLKEYKEKFPGATVVAETRSDKRHEELRKLGAVPRTRAADLDFDKAKNIVFCASPSGNDDYVGEVRRAVGLWGGGPGRMVFTSSAGVYAEENGGLVDEHSPVADNARVNKLVESEKVVLEAGGTVLRLSGLYSLDRGAHSYWIKEGKCTGLADGLIGLVSYEDSAKAALSTLTCSRNVHGEVFIVSDGAEQSRRQIVASALKTAMYRNSKSPIFTDSGETMHSQGKGKKYATDKIRSTGWKPTYPSFDAFCEAHK